MALDTTVYNTDILAVTAEMPASMTLREKTFSVMSGEVDVSQKSEFEGMWGENAVLVVAPISLFDAASPVIARPMNNEIFSLSGRQWRITGVKTSPDAISLQIRGVTTTK